MCAKTKGRRQVTKSEVLNILAEYISSACSLARTIKLLALFIILLATDKAAFLAWSSDLVVEYLPQSRGLL